MPQVPQVRVSGFQLPHNPYGRVSHERWKSDVDAIESLNLPAPHRLRINNGLTKDGDRLVVAGKAL